MFIEIREDDRRKLSRILLHPDHAKHLRRRGYILVVLNLEPERCTTAKIVGGKQLTKLMFKALDYLYIFARRKKCLRKS